MSLLTLLVGMRIGIATMKNNMCCGLLQTGTWWTGVDEKKERKRERERAVSLGLRRKPIKPLHTGLVPLVKAQGVLSRRS